MTVMSDRRHDDPGDPHHRDGMGAAEARRVEGDPVDRAVREMRAFLDARPAPEVTTAVMQRLQRLAPEEAPGRAGVVGRAVWTLWRPREVAVRPAYGLLAAAALVVLVSWSPGLLQNQTGVPAAEPTEAARRLLVQFRLEADAASVHLAGSFTNWEPAYQMHQIAAGVWTVTVPLPQGVHDYAFVVDGQQWVADPYAPRIGDGFGGTNSRLTVLLKDMTGL
jgi:hypothetical protein